MRALNTTKESTEVPKDRYDNDKGNVPENALSGGLEKYWHEMIQVAVMLVGKLFL